MTESTKFMLGSIGAVIIGIGAIRYFYINVSMFFARKAVMKNPTEENAMRVFKLLRAPLGVSINNHPKDWAKFRDMFYHINGSAEIPSELKERIKAHLVKKGLYINNMRIINNYKGNTPAPKA